MSIGGWFRMAMAGVALTLSASAWAAEAKDFKLRDINGQEVTLSQYKGSVVVLSFWATWCGPCKVEMPHLDKMYGELKDQGFVVLSVSSDDARTTSQVKPFIKKSGYSFPVLLDTQSTVTGTYNPTKTLPYTVIIGRDGQVAKEHSGYNPGDEVALRAEIEELLKAPKP
jgi:peroxiredoxin